tara:strand:- start:1002 stop:1598 length:597 start_codon:yes stop_codon:yes gene_type:complete
MSEQFIYIVDFPNLHNILSEVKNLFNFKIKNFTSFKIFLEADECTQVNDINSIIIVNKKKQEFLLSKKTIDKNILIIDELPLRIEKLIYKINIQLIKQHYSIQSKVNVKGYMLDLNKRIIKNESQELKLTEKEINIILFLLKSEKAQSINNLQESVWKYSRGLETHTVETHIYRMRKKFLEKFNDNNFINSVNNAYKI